MFETLIIQPIFNLLLVVYSILPGNDFGVAVIIFTVLIRFAMWPLLKKQLHQTKVMKELQPEIKKLKKKANGDRQLEGQLMMELYREKGVNPFSQIGLLFVQLPVFIGLFSALRSLESPARLISMPYSWVRSLEPVQAIISNVTTKTNEVLSSGQAGSEAIDRLSGFGVDVSGPVSTAQLESLSSEQLEILYNQILVSSESGATETLVNGPFFDQLLFGVIDLSRAAIQAGSSVYWPLMVVAVLAGVFQYLQTKQITANNASKDKNAKTIGQILKESKDGKEPDQGEINSAVGSRMSMFFAPLIGYISAISLGGLSVYFLTSGVVGYVQQRFVLNQDVEEMEEIADEPTPPSKKTKEVSSKPKGSKKTTQKNKKNTSKSASAKRNKKKR